METPEELAKKEFFRFEEGRLREGKILDNTIFWVSTGSLALSINFIIGLRDVVFINPTFLVFSWISFLINIIVYILGFKFSVSYHVKVQQELSNWARNGYKPFPIKHSKNVHRLEKIILCCNDISLFFLVLGMISITFFAVTNFLYLQN